jgi:hypothetical protein
MLPRFTSDTPDLVEQCGNAFKKIWTHRKEPV